MAYKFDWVIDLLKRAHDIGYRSAIAGLTLPEAQQLHEKFLTAAVELAEKEIEKQKGNKNE